MLDLSPEWQTGLLWLACFVALLIYRAVKGWQRGGVAAATLLGWFVAMLGYSFSAMEFGNAARDGQPRFSYVEFAYCVVVGAIVGAVFGLLMSAPHSRHGWTFSLRSMMLFVAVVALLVVLLQRLYELFFGW